MVGPATIAGIPFASRIPLTMRASDSASWFDELNAGTMVSSGEGSAFVSSESISLPPKYTFGRNSALLWCRETDMEDNNKFGWFLAGAVVGAAIAILYTPKSGKDTRAYIGNSAKEGREAMESSGRELMERGKELYDRGKKIAEDAADLFERGRKLVQG